MAGAAAALCASLAFAHPHGGPGGGGGGHRDAARGWQGAPHAQSRMGVSSCGARWGLRPMAMPSYGQHAPRGREPAYDSSRGPGLQGRYAPGNPYRPISANPESMQRAGGGNYAPMRSGSIRADVARYNEERGGRPAPQPRAQEGGGARNTFFSSFYRNN
ncbi:peptide-binding protein [Burkholderia sp. Ac-20379]|uniref:peptide-binding protein n=1 Tax=Burkholderia sp. Ac-20379 TaxID=2703900 RepID=UPI001F11D644|nr:peptide-binding protein [Burkholderia sp. Ac-20379]